MNQHWKTLEANKQTYSICWLRLLVSYGWISIYFKVSVFVILKEFLMPGLIQQKKSMEN